MKTRNHIYFLIWELLKRLLVTAHGLLGNCLSGREEKSI